jgi:hypothetical protein
MKPKLPLLGAPPLKLEIVWPERMVGVPYGCAKLKIIAFVYWFFGELEFRESPLVRSLEGESVMA